jgi:dipeptidyl aminopeptidase/acylaminoacyl peptidase
MERLAIFAVLLLGLWPALVYAEGKRPIKVEDLFKFQRVGDPQISPDGKLVVYTLGTVDLKANKTATHLWIVPTAGGEPRQLTSSGKRDAHPRWSPDGKSIVFESNRGGSPQLWIISLEGGEARQLTSLATGASGGLFSPDGKWVAFVSTVYPEFSNKPFAESDKLNREKTEAIEKGPVKAKVFTKLFYRHWDEYVEDKRQHIFVVPVSGGEPKDLTPGDRDYNPTSTTFSMGDDFCWSPDSSHLLVTAPPERNEAWSTNYAILRVPVTGGKIDNLTSDNLAADGSPRFSPDGKWLVYRSQKKAGYEADRWDLKLVQVSADGKFDSGAALVLTGAALDRSVGDYAWFSPGVVYFAADNNGATSLYSLDVASRGRAPTEIESIKPRGLMGSLSVCPATGGVVATVSRLSNPNEVFLIPGDKPAVNLSKANAKLLDELDLPRPESVLVDVEGAKMQMWLLKPPGFDPNKKWPLVYLVHGGPQGAWEDGWSFRWNPETWAAQGYVVALPNPRGSTGFGQKFCDDISGDWGGKCYDDLMKGVAYLEKLPYIDTDRMASAGASFGGYMMNWFQGNTTKFKTLITHCGVYNFESMYATTEELWFDEWEHGGPPWGPNRASYEKHSPHKKAANFKTPMLIIHNDLDFRVPVSEGHQLFTTLQRLGIPSKFINFPDEGHWVLKPANSEFWHKEVFAWLAKYCPPGGK